jgi:hypothetical protein
MKKFLGKLFEDVYWECGKLMETNETDCRESIHYPKHNEEPTAADATFHMKIGEVDMNS